MDSEKYDVFISFRGEDTRDNFTSHLYEALVQKKIHTYIDSVMLNKGDEISPAIKRAIEESKLSVIVFSESYASSTWCLDELVHVLKCKRNGQFVVPVFYKVHPKHVQKQKGGFERAFSELERRFGKSLVRVKEWRDALAASGNMPGWSSMDISPESKLVKSIVDDVLKKLNHITPNDDIKGLVGINRRVEKIEKLLDIGSPDVRIIGIWGMGGIGKTTLASVVFNRLASRYESCCFLSDIRKESDRHGMSHLQKKLVSELLEDKRIAMNYFRFSSFGETRLRRKTAFVVLDDVDDPEQLELLVGYRDRFCSGSRIIVTTRDVQVLRSIEADEIYKAEELDENEALELFSSVVFRKSHTRSLTFLKLSKSAVDYAGGVPLALKVLASFLGCRDEEKWESALEKLKKVPSDKIQSILRTSFENLDNDQKRVFLDISCFFRGEDRNFVERISNCCEIEIDDLIDKSLVTVTHDNKVWMHDLVQEMGRQVVRKQSVDEPGKRSRLWDAQEIVHVLRNNTGTEAVQGICLDMSKTKDINFNPEVFQKMCNLRYLKIYNSPRGDHESNVCPYEDLRYFSDKLTYLQWDGYLSRFLPVNFSADNLVELIMPNSRVNKLWSGVQTLGSLKKVDLSSCGALSYIPDLSHAPNLTTLSLEGCSSVKSFPELPQNIKSLNMSRTAIKEVPSSIIDCVSNLETFDLSECQNLETLPPNICKLKSLKSLYLSASWNFNKFPEILEPMVSLEELELDRTRIRELHPSIENLVGLQLLHLERCYELEFVPENIYNITSLEYVSLWQCYKLKSSPRLPTKLEPESGSESVPSSRTVLVECWDPYANARNPSRFYNYIQRVPAETASSSASQNCPELMILEPNSPRDRRLTPNCLTNSYLQKISGPYES